VRVVSDIEPHVKMQSPCADVGAIKLHGNLVLSYVQSGKVRVDLALAKAAL
jgi:hypothetical protein